MKFFIHQARDIWIYKDDTLFLFVKRKYRWDIVSEFFKDMQLFLRIKLFALMHLKWISISYQSLSTDINLIRENNKFTLLEGGNEFFIDFKSGILSKPLYDLYLNGVKQGTIMAPTFAKLGAQEYIMETETADENHNLFFLVLFVSQLHNIG